MADTSRDSFHYLPDTLVCNLTLHWDYSLLATVGLVHHTGLGYKRSHLKLLKVRANKEGEGRP